MTDADTGAEPTISRTITVGEADTAQAVGSGAVAVLGTPRVLALCEGLTVELADQVGVAEGRTTVGTRVELDHLRPSPVGAEVTVTATLLEHDGRRWSFSVSAAHGDGTVVARGVVRRAEVVAEGFGT